MVAEDSNDIRQRMFRLLRTDAVRHRLSRGVLAVAFAWNGA